ncbi:MAG: hypothetical protein QOI73_90 [Solirubrobacteraceae bacterium]|nr:hypothetical protein [Solirubrobacteraceae bacterium]
MEILVVILAIALIAVAAYAILQRRRPGARGLPRPRAAARDGELVRRRGAHSDPMAAAVAEHAQATDPGEVVVAEQRLRAQARNVAAGLQADQPAGGYVEPVPGNGGGVSGYGDAASSSSYADPHAAGAIDPQTGERIDGYGDPANDPRLNDRRYEGRLASDYVDPNEDERRR